MKVARHEMPGKWPKMTRPVGNGVIRGARFYSPSKTNPDTLADQYHIRRGGDGFLDGAFPGISCLATIMLSLWDGSQAGQRRKNFLPQVNLAKCL